MTIINPNSISGITSFTAEADVMNFYRSNGTLGGLQLNGVNFNTTNGISTFNNLNVGGTITYEDVKNVDSVGIISARTAIHVGAGISAVGIITGTSFRGDGSQLTGITQVGGATTVGFDDDKPIYFGSQDDYKMRWNGTTMYFEPTSSSTTQILHLTSNNQMYIKSKASGLFLMSGNQNVIDIYGGYGGGIYFKNNNTQYLKLEYSNWTFLNNTEVRIPDKLVHAGDENTSIRFPAADTITAETGGSERLRIASDGDVTIDSSSNSMQPGAAVNIISDKNVETGVDDMDNYHLALKNPQNDTGEAIGLAFGITDTDSKVGAAIIHERDGAGSYGSLKFLTRPDNSGPPVERLRITSSGDIGIGAAPTSGLRLHIKQAGNPTFRIEDTDASNSIFDLGQNNGESQLVARGPSSTNGTFVFYQHDGSTLSVAAKINASGYLGINCTPSKQLQVKGLDVIARLESTAATGRNILEFYDSSASKGSIGYPSSGNDNFAIQQSENADMWFSTSDTERFRIQSNGIALFGTTTAAPWTSRRLTVSETSSGGTTAIEIRSATNGSGRLYFTDGTSGGADSYAGKIWYDHADDAMKFNTGGGTSTPAERVRITASGDMGVGTNSPDRKLDVSGTGNVYGKFQSTNATGAGIELKDTAERWLIQADGGVGPGLAFYDLGRTSYRMIINSAGKVLVGRTSSITIASDPGDACFEQLTDNGMALTLHCNKTNKRGFGIYYPSSSGATDFIRCQIGNNAKFLVTGNGNAQNANNSYGNISDASLKENIVDANSQWNDIKNIKIRNFNFKASTDHETHTQIGVIAQEVETVCPKLVDSSGKGGIKTVASSVLYMKAIKCLQEAMGKIETLEAKVASLEGS